MNILLLTLILSFQDAPVGDDIWTQIGDAEQRVSEAVKAADSQFAISATNPVRGYHVAGKGVFLVVPLRYRALSAYQLKTKNAGGDDAAAEEDDQPAMTRDDFQKRLSQWEERKRKYEITREANFQRVVNRVRAEIPAMMAKMNLLPQEGLVIAIEEAPPAYYYANFSLKRNPTRRVVTLVVDSSLVQMVKTNKIERDSDWLSQIKATTVQRALAASP